MEAECFKPFRRNPDSVSDLLDKSRAEAECFKPSCRKQDSTFRSAGFEQRGGGMLQTILL
jgi:hypothetical protein